MTAEIKNRIAQTDVWLATYHSQRKSVYQPALRFARKRTNDDDLRAKELVEEALVDTLYAVVTWDPDEKSLRRHIIDVIRWRTKNDFARAKKFKHEYYDTCEAGDETRAAHEVSRARERRPSHDDAVDEAFATLRRLATGDDDVTAWLDSVYAGATGPADVMEATKMTKTRFHAARERLRRIAHDMPNHLWLAVRGRS